MILDEIVAAKRAELAGQHRSGYFRELRGRPLPKRRPRDFGTALRRPGELHPGRAGVIAEVKRASPSRGLLRADLDPAVTARIYEEAGACAISVLTERRYFLGEPAYLATVRRATDLPLLRKDFVLEMEQVYESLVLGADAVLLIVAILDDRLLAGLLAEAGRLGLQCLVEVHDEEELRRALRVGARIIGINNRDLRTFRTDLGVTERLAPLVPRDCTLVAESGILTGDDVARVTRCGAHAVLVGEALVREADMGAKLRELAGAGGTERGGETTCACS